MAPPSLLAPGHGPSLLLYVEKEERKRGGIRGGAGRGARPPYASARARPFTVPPALDTGRHETLAPAANLLPLDSPNGQAGARRDRRRWWPCAGSVVSRRMSSGRGPHDPANHASENESKHAMPFLSPRWHHAPDGAATRPSPRLPTVGETTKTVQDSCLLARHSCRPMEPDSPGHEAQPVCPPLRWPPAARLFASEMAATAAKIGGRNWRALRHTCTASLRASGPDTDLAKLLLQQSVAFLSISRALLVASCCFRALESSSWPVLHGLVVAASFCLSARRLADTTSGAILSRASDNYASSPAALAVPTLYLLSTQYRVPTLHTCYHVGSTWLPWGTVSTG
ncbi:hypothetical protein CDD82_4027 [Ophiocordyceps australis]|uniref:Uncharacterized protein n=1 Tax=Ophiocordyceps australis TaxID=1399860 RepID=A0A2C5Z944_9HYPO|nr:hypothetical protein CDD82_4027 [Ophiocordyceps australis]